MTRPLSFALTVLLATAAVASTGSETIVELEGVSAEMQAATIRIHHDATYPSKLLLPAIPNR